MADSMQNALAGALTEIAEIQLRLGRLGYFIGCEDRAAEASAELVELRRQVSLLRPPILEALLKHRET